MFCSFRVSLPDGRVCYRYELEYIENHAHIKRGHRVLQIAFGSGFKCNSAVWLRMR